MNETRIDVFEMLEKEDSTLNQELQTWKNHVYARTGLPRDMKELLMLAMCCVTNHEVGIKSHCKKAYKAGASREAILDTILQTALIGGMPAYRRGANAYIDLFYDEKPQNV